MKSFTLAFVFTLLVVAVFAQETKRCSTSDDCKDTECCVNQGIFGGGRCKPLAKQDESCSEPEDIDTFEGQYSRYCPCEAGLQCEIEDLDTPVGDASLNKMCVAEGSVATAAPAEE